MTAPATPPAAPPTAAPIAAPFQPPMRAPMPPPAAAPPAPPTAAPVRAFVAQPRGTARATTSAVPSSRFIVPTSGYEDPRRIGTPTVGSARILAGLSGARLEGLRSASAAVLEVGGLDCLIDRVPGAIGEPGRRRDRRRRQIGLLHGHRPRGGRFQRFL